MRIKEIKTKTPQQERIVALKKQKEVSAKALKAEQNRQRISKAQQQISNAIQSNAANY